MGSLYNQDPGRLFNDDTKSEGATLLPLEDLPSGQRLAQRGQDAAPQYRGAGLTRRGDGPFFDVADQVMNPGGVGCGGADRTNGRTIGILSGPSLRLKGRLVQVAGGSREFSRRR